LDGCMQRAQASAIPRLSPGVCGRRRRGARSAGLSIRISGKVKTTRRSSLGDFGHSRLALRREGSDRHRGCYPTDPTGEGCPSFRRDAGRSIPFGRSVLRPGGRCFIQSGAQGCPCLPARTKTHLPQSRRVLPPDLRSPSPSAGPWGNALLRRALRRSRTRPRRSPGRASSQPHAWGLTPLALGRFQEASRDGGAVLHRRRRRLPTPPQTAPEASPLG